MEHGRLPGEWYGVSKMNEIFTSLNETYNFDSKLSENSLGLFKICNFKNGEINEQEVLEMAVGGSSQDSTEEADDSSIIE